MALMRGLQRLDPARSLRPYLYGIARHVCGRRRRREWLWVSLDGDTPQPAIETTQDVIDQMQQRDDLSRLRRAIAALPLRHREVIVMCDLKQMSYEDAAGALRCAVGTIRSRLHRARARLASDLGRDDAANRIFAQSTRYAL